MFFVFACLQTAVAQTGEWQVEEGGRIRVSYDTNPRRGVEAGEVHGVIEVELEPGWKTYWKNPGSSGMAPQLQFFYQEKETEKTLSPLGLYFALPAPKLFEEENEEYVNGYQERVLFSFSVTSPKDVTKIFGKLSIGLCKDVCLPVSMHFLIYSHTRADPQTKARIELAQEAIMKRSARSFEVEKVGIFRLHSTRKAKIAYFHIKVFAKMPDDARPQLFVYARNVQFSKPKLLKKEGNEFIYRVDIVSGELEQADKLEYVVVLGDESVFNYFRVQQPKEAE